MAVAKLPQDTCELPKVERVLQEALSLSTDNRKALLAALQDSLDGGDDWDDDFAAELSRRADAIDAGEPTASFEEVVVSLRASLDR